MKEFNKLVLYLNQDCDFGCKHCFIPNKNNKEMTIQIAKDSIDFFMNTIQKQSKDSYEVELFGGNPILSINKFEPIIKHYKTKWKSSGKKLSFTTDTHEIKKFDKFNGFLKQEMPNYRQTMTNEDDDTGWRYCCPKGDKQLKRIKKAKADNEFINDELPVAKLPLTPTNSKDMIKQVQTLIDDGFENIMLFPIVRTEWDKHLYYHIFKNELKKLADWYIENIKKSKKIPPVQNFNRMLILYHNSLQGVGKPENPCTSGTMVIDSEGNILGCRHQFEKKQWILGDIYNGINQVKLESYYAFSYIAFQGCRNCEANKVCPGPCTALIEDYNHDNFYPITAHCIFVKNHFQAVKYLYHTLDMYNEPVFKKMLKNNDKKKLLRD